MKIIKCGCGRNIHVFSHSGNMSCPFCGALAGTNLEISKPYEKPFLFLNDNLTEIDARISTLDFEAAKKLIAEALAILPGPEIGPAPKSGEIHWRKLLANIGCKNDTELFSKGMLLHEYPAFKNAEKYANAEEASTYALINNAKNSILAEVIKTLDEQEIIDKADTGVKDILEKCQTKLMELQKNAQEKILKLEKIEKDMREYAIDYEVAVEEYKRTISTIYLNIRNVGNRNNEISEDEKNTWINELDVKSQQCDKEIQDLELLKNDNEHYLKYHKLAEAQKDFISKIRQDIALIDRIGSEARKFFEEKIKPIEDKFLKAKSAIDNGDYEPAKNLIGSRFDLIFKKVIGGILC